MGSSSSTLTWEKISSHNPKDLLTAAEWHSIQTTWGNRRSLNFDDFCNIFFVHQVIVDDEIKLKLWNNFRRDGGRQNVDEFTFARNILILRHGNRECIERLLGDILPPEIDFSNIHWIKKDAIFNSFEEVLTSVTHFNEFDISVIFEFLKKHNKTESFNFEEFSSLITIPCSDEIKKGLFNVFNVYQRPNIALTEYVSGLSSITRGPAFQRYKTFAKIWDPDRNGFLPLHGIKQFYNDSNISEKDRTLHMKFKDKILYEDFVIWAAKCSAVSIYLDYLSFMIGCVCLGAPIEDYEEAAKTFNKVVLDLEPDHFEEWIILTNNQYIKVIEALGTKKLIKIDYSPSESLEEKITLFKDIFPTSQYVCRRNLVLKKDFFPIPSILYESICYWLKLEHPPKFMHRTSCNIKTLVGEWPTDWYQPKPSSSHFYDLYMPHALFLYLNTLKVVNKKFDRQFLKVVPIDRDAKIYDVVKVLVEKNIFSARFRLRVIQVDANPLDSLVTEKSNVADFGCFETIIFLLEERESKKDDWPSHEILEGNEAELTKVVFSRVTGLVNLGRTCYLNVALQLFADIKCMGFLRSKEFWQSNLCKDSSSLLFQLSRVYFEINNCKAVVSPTDFKKVFLSKSEFPDHYEHDCHEAFEKILNILHDECAPFHIKPSNGVVHPEPDSPIEKGEIEWQKHLQSGISFITTGFEGQTRSDLKCTGCGNISYSFEPFKSFNLTLQDHNINVKYIVVNLVQTLFVEKVLQCPQDLKMDAFLGRVAEINGTSAENLFVFLAGATDAQQKSVIEEPENLLLRTVIAMNDNDAFHIYQFPKPYNQLSNQLCIARQRLIRNSRTALVDRIHRYGIVEAGAPYIFNYENELNGEKLYKFVMNYFNLIKNEYASGEEGTALNRALYENEKTEDYPFYLVYCESTGLRCPKCHWTLYCIGCIIPQNSDIIPYEFAKYISVQWKYMPYFLKWNGILTHSRISDNSVFQIIQKNSPGRKINITECMKNAVFPEILDTQLTCEKCKIKTYHEKKVSINRLPETLVINIKRFILSRNNRWVKDKAAVKFPLHDFNVGEYTTVGHSDTVYECTGFVVHKGELEGGHYVCYCKRKGYWYYINDEESSLIDEDEMDLRGATLIVYQKAADENDEEENNESSMGLSSTTTTSIETTPTTCNGEEEENASTDDDDDEEDTTVVEKMDVQN